MVGTIQQELRRWVPTRRWLACGDGAQRIKGVAEFLIEVICPC